MTSQFSVISNARLNITPQAPAPRSIEDDAHALLTGRQFHVCGTNAEDAIDLIQPYTGGMFLTGQYAPAQVSRLQRTHPSLPMIAEPRAVRKYWANEDAPFQLDAADGELFPPSLDWTLSVQRLSGNALAMTPTGQIRAGDSATLKNALRAANELDRADILFTLPLEAGWLSNPDYVLQVIKVIDRSRHPVALTFTHNTNPLASRKRMRAYRRIFAETTGTVLAYRTDLFGFDARAHGAIASAIGAYPRVRRLTPVDGRGGAIDPADKAPHMLVGDMLRFVRTKHMRRNWFAEADPFVCFCPICNGRDIDRLFGTPADRTIGHMHNVIEIGRLHDATLGLTPTQLRAEWTAQVLAALDTYPQLETHLNRQVAIPTDLDVWAEPI